MLTITLPIKTKLGLNAREHWRARHGRAKRERGTAAMVFGAAFRKAGLALPCAITLIRLSPGTMDDDNLPGTMKSIRDGIADAIGVADNDPRIRWGYGQRKVKRREFGVLIEVRT